MAGNIFINYRRGDDPGFTQALFGRLEQTFSTEQLFIDIDGIEPGVDFVRVVDEQIAKCDVLLAVIGKAWIDARDETSARRLENPEDFVRIEIESALNQDKRVIPVLVGDARMPRSEELPDVLKPLTRRNAVRLTHERFREDADGFIKELERALEQAESRRTAQEEAARHAQAEEKRRQVQAQERQKGVEDVLRSLLNGRRREEDEKARRAAEVEAQEFREALAKASWLGKAPTRESYAAVPTPAADNGRGKGRNATLDEAETYLSLEDIAEPEMLEPSVMMDESRPSPRQRQTPPTDLGRVVAEKPRRSLADMIKLGVSLAIVAAFAGLLLYAWPYLSDVYRSLRTPAAPQQTEDTTTPAAGDANAPGRQIKNSGRSDPGATQQASAAAAVAPRVVLLEEVPNDPQGRHSVGSVIWRTEAVSPGPNKRPELAIHADVEIPERGMSMTFTLKRVSDQSGPTSHTIEIMFKLPPDFAPGGIFNVPGVWMKQSEQERGTALAGLAVKVTTGYFLIGLSSAPTDKEGNVELLKDWPWFDIGIVYTNNERAILSLEKATPGDRVFQQAFAAWEPTSNQK